MAYDKGLAARMADTLAALGERAIRQKNVFGGRGFLVRKHTFAIAWDEGLLVALVPWSKQGEARILPSSLSYPRKFARSDNSWPI